MSGPDEPVDPVAVLTDATTRWADSIDDILTVMDYVHPLELRLALKQHLHRVHEAHQDVIMTYAGLTLRSFVDPSADIPTQARKTDVD